MPEIVSAAMLAIGDELLSGRTRDKNVGHLASVLTLSGIDLKEVRIVSDEQADIVDALNALRTRYDYVFTSGGIGPTHDDITADAIAAAFEVPISHDPRAMAILTEHYNKNGLPFTDARKQMARIPDGADLIDNPISKAPGFIIGNVHVMAGVPAIFQIMLDNVLPLLRTGSKILSEAIDSPFPEGTIGGPLGEIQRRHPETAIGSYPRHDGEKFTTQIIIRSRDASCIEAAKADVSKMFVVLANTSS